MTLSYLEALGLITAEAERAVSSASDRVSLFNALNRASKCTHRSPNSTPQFDTSAMDGYALNSEATRTASPESPIVFHVKGMAAAGDEPACLSGEPGMDPGFGSNGSNAVFPCVEIMTGARFPEAIGRSRTFDCCIKWEDVTVLERKEGQAAGNCYIQVVKPAQFQQNRRLAGSDFKMGDVVVAAGETIRPRHIMALSSVGVTEVQVIRKPKVGIFSTGTELLSPDTQRPDLHRIQDANGPYITACLEDLGADVEFLGVLDDGLDTMTRTLEYHLHEARYGVIISTGAVSTGRFDLIPAALQRLGSSIMFHKINIRPGHPVLFARIPRSPSEDDTGSAAETVTDTAFFGMPGNPVACAACLRFLVIPYLQRREDRALEPSLKAIARHDRHEEKAVKSNGTMKADIDGSLISKFPAEKDIFRPGVSYRRSSEELEVVLINDNSPGKIKPFLAANCWIHIHQGVSELRAGDTVDIIVSE